MAQVVITTDTVELILETRDTETARQILAALPVRARAMKWGEEVYFMVPVNAGREADAKPVVEPGEIGFWTQGHAITIGYGRTPLSTGREIRLAAPCNIWADAQGDVRLLEAVEEGDEIELKRVL